MTLCRNLVDGVLAKLFEYAFLPVTLLLLVSGTHGATTCAITKIKCKMDLPPSLAELLSRPQRKHVIEPTLEAFERELSRLA